MRKLMWFTIGFAAACCLCAYFLVDDILAFLCTGAGAGFGLCLLLGRRYRWLFPVGAVCLGLAVGFGWFSLFMSGYLKPALHVPEEPLEITARAVDYGYDTGYGTGVEAVTELDGKPFRIRLYLSGEPDIEPGDQITGEFRLKALAWGDYRQGEGTFLTGYQAEDAQLGKFGKNPWWVYPAVLRRNITLTIDTLFPADTAGFAKALLLGDRSDLSYETETAFKVSGISHIIAVSGLHVSILFALVYLLGLHNRWLTALLGIPALMLFAAVAGFSPSITRACIMQILMLLAMCLDKEYDPPTALAFAGLVMLAVNPMTITSISFQLSVGCMAGIFLFREPIAVWMKKHLPRPVADGIAVTLSAMTLTTPLVALYFGTVSLVGVLTNLLVLWVVSFIFYGIMAVCLLASVWTAGAGALAWLTAWPIRYVLGVSGLLAKFPLAAVYTESVYIVFWLAFVYILLLIFWAVPGKRPGTLLCCGVLSLLIALGLSWAEPLLHGCRMTVLDVGQGQSILLQSGGKTWLVDCGGSRDEEAADIAAETLLSQGVFRLDGMIITHYDRDHAGGAAHLLSRVPADVVFMPDVPDETGTGEAIAALADETVYVMEDLTARYGDTEMTIFGPALTDNDNESSLCILFRAGNCDILITGDRSGFGEMLLMRRTELPRLEILVAGHHGAKSSTSEELLEATRPAIAVISVGDNFYGHPSEELLARLAECGCAVYRTDRDGTLTFRR